MKPTQLWLVVELYKETSHFESVSYYYPSRSRLVVNLQRLLGLACNVLVGVAKGTAYFKACLSVPL